MIRRYLARRKMRWAVRNHRNWKVQFWVEQRRRKRRPADCPVITVTTFYGYAEMTHAKED